MDRFVNTADRLPRRSGRYLVRYSEGPSTLSIATFDAKTGKWRSWPFGWVQRVASWLPFPGWFSVEERLPDTSGQYLIHAPSADPNKPLVALAWYTLGGVGWSMLPKAWLEAITHWWPLLPPEGE